MEIVIYLKSSESSMSFQDPGHASNLLVELNKQRLEEKFCDIMLNVSGENVHAHRNILSASSPYFAAMFNGSFNDSTKDEVLLQLVDSNAFRVIIDYIYTGKFSVNANNVQSLLLTSAFLQMKFIQEKCCEFLVSLVEVENCLALMKFAEEHHFQDLKEAVLLFVVEHFEDVVKYEDFLKLSFEDLYKILYEPEIYRKRADDFIFEALLKWANQSKDKRQPYLQMLVDFIHPEMISKDIVLKAEFILKDPGCAKWVSKVLNYEGKFPLKWNFYILDKIGKTSDLWKYNVETSKMTQMANLPNSPFGVSMVGYKNVLFATGGAIGNSQEKCFYNNIYRNKWFSTCPLHEPRSHHRSLVLGDSIISVAGTAYTYTSLSSVERYDIETEKVFEIMPIKEARSSMGAVTYENCIYVMGGETDRKNIYSVERYDPRSGNWVLLNRMHYANGYCTAAVVDQAMYVTEGLSNYMERYDFRMSLWERINLGNNREFYELFSFDSQLYSVSGTEISKYSIINNIWSTVYTFQKEREWDTIVPLPERVY